MKLNTLGQFRLFMTARNWKLVATKLYTKSKGLNETYWRLENLISLCYDNFINRRYVINTFMEYPLIYNTFAYFELAKFCI